MPVGSEAQQLGCKVTNVPEEVIQEAGEIWQHHWGAYWKLKYLLAGLSLKRI